MALIVVSAIASRFWIESIHERVLGAAEHPWNEGTARLKIDFGGRDALVELYRALLHAEGRRDLPHYSQLVREVASPFGVQQRDLPHYSQLVPLAKIVYLPFPWVPSATPILRGTAREPSFVGNSLELSAQLRAMGITLKNALGALPEVPNRVPPVELSTSSASAGRERVKATWLALSYAAWLSVETKTPLHGIYGEDETTYPEENWQLE